MKRSAFFQQIGLGATGVALFHQPVLASLLEQDTYSDQFYVGSYSEPAGQGISICRFNPANGAVKVADAVTGVSNPSFLIFNPTRRFVYAVNETADFEGQKSGSVSSFLKNEKTGSLTFLNSKPSLGANPCHLTFDRTGRFILVANYTGGNVAVLPVLPEGLLATPVEMVQHSGKGPNAARQEGPHAHSVNLSPDNRFAFVCDLGIDKIMIYQFDQKTGRLKPADVPFFKSAPGAGPRHFSFSKDGRNAYVVNELNSTITSLKYDPSRGTLTELESLSTLPEGFTGENTCADIHIHPNGRFVYASNRGHDSIAVFQADPESGKLKLIQNQTTLGKTPRNFAIHSSGRFLLAANQNSGSVHVFSVDMAGGRLAETGKSIQISKPVCILL